MIEELVPINNKIDNVSIDNINLRFRNVTTKEFNKITDTLHCLKDEEKLFDVKEYNSAKPMDYAYNLRIPVDEVVASEGAIYIGYLHNSNLDRLKGKTFDMKVEFNPSKSTYINDIVFNVLDQCIKNKKVELIEFDIAIDIPYKIKDVYSVSNKGRLGGSCETTRYYGSKHKDGYLKIYDKAKERKEFIKNVNSFRKRKGMELLDETRYIPDHDVTRIEVTIKPNDEDETTSTGKSKKKKGLNYKQLLKHRFDFDNLYTIGTYIGIESFIFRSVMYSIISGDSGIELKNFPKEERKEIKAKMESLKETNNFRMNYVLKSNWKQLCSSIEQWFFTDEKELERQELQLAFKEFEMLGRDLREHSHKTGKSFTEHFEELISESPDRSVEVSPEGQRIKEINKLLMELESEKLKLKEQFKHKKNLNQLAVE